MSRVRLYIVGSLIVVVLAGCGRSLFNYVQREAWRHDAEAACMRSGSFKENPALVRIEPIEGPGMCGADYPLKVSALGSAGVLGFANDLQPPAPIPGGRSVYRQPRWPIAETPKWEAPPSRSPPESEIEAVAAPLSIHPPGVDEDAAASPLAIERSTPAITPARPFYRLPPADVARPDYAPSPSSFDLRPPGSEPAPRPRNLEQPSFDLKPPVRLGPAPGQRITASIGPVALKPAATLACPIVSALDQWIVSTVQPAAIRWFGQPVVQIRQISAYSCRGMNGNPRARISEHAFGNALDIAGFTLADGHTITIKRGWRGTPEEQGFLRDVQGGACETFTTVLAPGSNRFHYDHMHVDLMRRRSGRMVCNPDAISGEVVAARARSNNHARGSEPTVTGSISSFAGKSDEGAVDDGDWIEHDGPRESVD